MGDKSWAKKLALIYAILFFLCGLAFLFAPDYILNFINNLSTFQSYFTTLEPATNRFWITLTFSMMMMITYASYKIYQSRQNRPYINILLLSKFFSSFVYMVLLFTEQRAFAYLLGFVVDGVIFLSILFLRQKMERA